VALLALLASAPVAQANPADLFGLGGASMGRGQTGIVLDADAYAAWRNPATMGLSEGSLFSFGGHGGWFRLNCLGEQTASTPPVCERNILYDGNQDGLVEASESEDYWPEESYENPGGIQFGYLAAAGKYFRIGFGLHLPGKRIVLFEQHDPYLPYYMRWKSRSQRLGIYLAGSVRIVNGLFVGVGVSVLARARLDLRFEVDANISDEDITAGEEGGSLAVDLIINPGNIGGDIRLALAPIVGVTWDMGNLNPKLEGVRLGVVYRHPIQILVDPAVLNLNFNAVVEEIGSLGAVLIPIRTQLVYSAVDFGTPRQIAVGLGWSRPRFQLGLDITWNQWSSVLPNTARIDEALTDVEIGLVDLETRVLNSRQIDNLDLNDTVSLRVGVEARPLGKFLSGKVGSKFREIGIVVRGGYGFEGAFTPEQTGLTNLLDNPVHSFSLGFGVWTWNPVPTIDGKISMDLFGQLHVLQPRTHTKEGSYSEGEYPEGWPTLGEVRSGGFVPTLGATLNVEL
jgi:long-subunit fatty acid transport protein